MRYTIFVLLLILSAPLMGQDYRNAAGIRAGVTDGFTYKRFINQNEALEMMLGFNGKDHGTQLYAIYQWHLPVPLDFTDDLYFVYGVGGHTGYIRPVQDELYYSGQGEYYDQRDQKTYYTLGIDGFFGVEYRIYSVPMTVGLDFKPYFEYYGFHYAQLNFWDAAISVKYIF